MEDEREKIRQRKLEELKNRAQHGSNSEPVAIRDQDHLQTVLENESAVVIDFYADWCGPCQQLAPVLDRLAADTQATVAKVDADELQGIAQRYGVRGLPTLVIAVEGEEAERLVGMQPESQLRSVIDQFTG